jgi:hypothetical protein
VDQEIRPISYKNAIQCLHCNEIIESKHRHDFKWCGCGSVAVDGGNDYSRRVGTDYIELSGLSKEKHEAQVL